MSELLYASEMDEREREYELWILRGMLVRDFQKSIKTIRESGIRINTAIKKSILICYKQLYQPQFEEVNSRY